ncbi:helix-turn-helix transcriptional regulator [Halalkalibacterium halodurans]|uniref:HTH cro/C1-type domain-containing protein n=1 Tax=Halalkalibacterium halodurans TaxID=86665 RepID=A0A0M0KMU0_ALKHA|nr:helix-turn-helix transcriptional regulator [Halalkalibacterium halodurans]
MLGERLKKLRNERKITQEELGKKVNVTKVSISGYENGNRNPDTETLQKLADFFEVSTDYLLGRTDDKPNEKKEVKQLSIAFRDGGQELTPDEEEFLEQQLQQFRELKKRFMENEQKDGK